MKAKILTLDGKEKGSIDMPKAFERKIREDIVSKVLEARKTQHPYSPSPVAGKQHSAKGKLVHRRHVWRSGYGRGQSRVPRKIFSQKGSQFNMEAAEVPNAKGGMRAHPPKVAHFMNEKKINKRELKVAFESLLSSTVNEKEISKRYASLEEKNLKKVPFIVEEGISKLKTKELLKSLKQILGDDLFKVAIQTKSVRSGRGKMRGRKYKSNAGMLLVTGKDSKLKANSFDIVKVDALSIEDLAKGGLGRLIVYTENAIKYLDKKMESKK